MRTFLLLSLLGLFSFSAEATEKEIDKIYSFMVEHIEDKTLTTPVVTSVIEEDLISEGGFTEIFSDVVIKNERLTFLRKTVKTQTLFKLDENGEKILPGENKDAVHVVKYVFTERKSTGEIFGIAYGLTLSGYEVAGKISFADQQLIVDMKSANRYDDAYSSQDGGLKPAVITYLRKFDIEDSELVYRTVETGFDIDLESGDLTEYASFAREYR